MRGHTNTIESGAGNSYADSTGYVPTNREKAKRGSKKKWWCSHCDMALVGNVGKCPCCGKRENRKKIKGT